MLRIPSPSKALLILLAAAAPTVTACSAASSGDESGSAAVSGIDCPDCAEDSKPEDLTFADLMAINDKTGHRSGGKYIIDGLTDSTVATKVQNLLTKPRISNAAFRAGAAPKVPALTGHPESDAMQKLGPTTRVTAWNLERGIKFSQVESLFAAAATGNAQPYLSNKDEIVDNLKADETTTLQRQLRELAESNILVLNEVDVGLARSEYADQVDRIATAMNMNYAFAPQFIESSDLNLGINKPSGKAADAYVVDTTKVRALNGNAVLSRYPIVKAEVFDLEAPNDRCFDWSQKDPGIVMDFFNKLAATVDNNLEFTQFFNWTAAERRHGGRSAVIVDVRVPGLDVGPEQNVVTVVAAQLEEKSSPKCRAQSMQRLRDHISNIQHPVVMMGDFHTTGGDGRPVTVERFFLNRLGNWQWYVKEFLPKIVPVAGTVFTVAEKINEFRTLQDPTGFDLPLLFPNPEKTLFNTIENLTFADGTHFDFRGDVNSTFNQKQKTLANSNQRDTKGFRASAYFGPTESDLGPVGALAGLVRKFDIADHMKVDWIFAKGYSKSSRNAGPERMAPHFPETYEELRNASRHLLSRHSPMTVLLPLTEPSDAPPATSTPPPATDDFGSCPRAIAGTTACSDGTTN